MTHFNLTATGFDPVNAIELAKAAQLSYRNDTRNSEVDNQLKAWNFDRYYTFDRTDHNTDTQAYIAGNDKVLILAFRGTEITQPRDIITDLNSKLIPMFENDESRIHTGFKEGFDIIRTDVIKTVQELRKRDQLLFLTGHSLGGALATIATVHLDLANEPVNGLYTFGSPRVGNAAFADKFQRFNSRTFRFVNHNDLVTRVALRRMKYQHVGQMMYFNVMGKLFSNITENRFLNFLGLDIEGILHDLLPSGWLGDHDMEKYKTWLEQALKSVSTQPHSQLYQLEEKNSFKVLTT